MTRTDWLRKHYTLGAVCEVCGASITKGERCTNSRCLECHGKYCTSGGNTSPGHGRGYPPQTTGGKR